MELLEARYLCRLCQKKYTTVQSNRDVAEETTTAMVNGAPPLEYSPKLCEVHHCSDGSIGVADFIGWKATESHPLADSETWGEIRAKMREQKERPALPRGYKWEGNKPVIDEPEAAKIRKAVDDLV